MIALIIAMLMSLGLVTDADDFNSRSVTEQQTLTEIVIEDLETN